VARAVRRVSLIASTRFGVRDIGLAGKLDYAPLTFHRDGHKVTDTYRLYRMNSLTGAILGYDEFEAFSDDQAIDTALPQAGSRRIELWCGSRKVLAVSGRGGPGELSFGPPAG